MYLGRDGTRFQLVVPSRSRNPERDGTKLSGREIKWDTKNEIGTKWNAKSKFEP